MNTILPIIMVCVLFLNAGYAQEADTTFSFKAELSVTNNGFSIIPAFTLGDPAAFLDMRMANKRLSFEPQFRFALEGRPWSFVFIYRYKAIERSRFQLSVGGHIPGLNFVTRTVTVNGVDEEMGVVRRFLAGEIIPSYTLSRNVSIGMYYLRGFGFQNDAARNANFLSLRASLTGIKIANKLFADFNPQVFYLTVDDSEGFYANATTTLGIRGFPLSVSNILNKAIHSNIPAKDFDWNISLIYTIDKHYVAR
jgi:hypothetical protein